MAGELYDEVYRPQFHFTAPRNWLNDPNGLVYHEGEYHLFYQHNPAGINWGNMTWGHAVSTDLIHWQHLPHALLPDRLGTMFSGSAVVDWANTAGFQAGPAPALVAIYTAAGGTSPESEGQPFTQCLAYSNDRGRTWSKHGGNPVLPCLVEGNRDPKVIWHAATRRWVMALYLDGNDYALLSSPDLKAWTRLQNLTLPGCSECPDFFPLPVEDSGEVRWVFTAANGHYLAGAFDGERFTPETVGPLAADGGANYYAVQTYSDIPPADGRRIQLAWMAHGEYPGMPFNQQMSFPCTLELRRTPQGLRLCRRPVREIDALHARRHSGGPAPLAPGQDPLAGLQGDLFDIHAEIELGSAREVGLVVRGQAIRFDACTATLSCLGRSAALAPNAGRINLRILVDRTSLEVFGNDGEVSLTSCFLPEPGDLSLRAYALGGPAASVALEVYELRSVWR